MFAIFSSLIRATLIAIHSSLIKVKVYTVILRKQSDQGLHYLPCSAIWSGSTLFAILSSLIKVKVYPVILRNSLIRVYTICHSQQSDQGLNCLPFSTAIWPGSRLFVILSSLIRIYTICYSFSAVLSRSALLSILSSLNNVFIVWHSRHSDQGIHYLPFSVWSGSTLFAVLSSLIKVKVYTVILRKQSDQGLHYLSFSAVCSGTILFDILSSLIKVKVHTVILRDCLVRVYTVILKSLICIYTVCHSQQPEQHLHCLPFSAVQSGSILFPILSSLIRVYSICHSQHSDQGLHYLPFSLSSIIKVYTVCHSQQSDQGYTTWLSRQSNQGQGLQCHFQKQSDQGLTFLPFSAVWSGSTLFAIVSSLIRVYTVWHYQQCDQGLHYLSFSTVWWGATLFAILSSLIKLIKVKIYTVILKKSLIKVYTICHSKQSDQGLQCLPFSAVFSRSTLFAILSNLIRV